MKKRQSKKKPPTHYSRLVLLQIFFAHLAIWALNRPLERTMTSGLGIELVLTHCDLSLTPLKLLRVSVSFSFRSHFHLHFLSVFKRLQFGGTGAKMFNPTKSLSFSLLTKHLNKFLSLPFSLFFFPSTLKSI